jgi:uncharacterized protein YutE (UPF0331/DUF86 family)
MTEAPHLRRSVIERIEARYLAEGYRVTRLRQQDEDVPGDFLVERDGEQRVVAVIRPGFPLLERPNAPLERWQSAAPGRHIDIVVASEADLLVPIASRELLEQKLLAVEALAAQKQADAALLLAWAVFEAAARRRLDSLGAEAPNGGAVIRALAREGVISQTESQQLSLTAAKRNMLAHGVFAAIDSAEIDLLVSAARDQLDDHEERPAPAPRRTAAR